MNIPWPAENRAVPATGLTVNATTPATLVKPPAIMSAAPANGILEEKKRSKNQKTVKRKME
jgi:hypothetical protein